MKLRCLTPSTFIVVAYIVGVTVFIDVDAIKVKGIAGETQISLLQNSPPRFCSFPKVARLCVFSQKKGGKPL